MKAIQDRYQSLLYEFTESKIFKTALFSIAGTTVLGNTIIAPSLPALQSHFAYLGTAIETLSKLILTMPALILVFFAPIAGLVFERYARLPVIFAALVLWSLSGAAGFLLDNIYLLLISRAILGIATAFLMTGVGVLIGDYYSGHRREKALSFQTFFMAFGGGIFLILGGYLANFDWRYPFLVYLLGFLILFLAAYQLFEPIKSIHHSHHNQPSKFDTKKFIPLFFLAFFSTACIYIAPTQIPFFMVHDLGMKQSSIGVCMAIFSVTMAIGSLGYQAIRKTFSIYEIFFIAFALEASGFGIISILHSLTGIIIGFSALGLALGFFTINNSSWLFNLADESERPRAYGFLASCMFLGQFASPIISQALVHHVGLIHMIGIAAFACFSVAFLFLFAKDTKTKESHER